MPPASLDLTGMANYELFLRGTLDKIGGYPDALHIGEYKTASNTFTENTFTPAHREMAESLNSDMYEQLIRGHRRRSEEVRAGIRADGGTRTVSCRRMRFAPVWWTIWRTRTSSTTKCSWAGSRASNARFMEEDEYRHGESDVARPERGPRIAVIYAVGIISSGESSYDSPQGMVAGSDTIVSYLRKARADSSVRAIVLRIDSPGGSAIASDVIWREVQLTRERVSR